MQHKLDDLKKKVHGKTGVPPPQQQLYYGNKLLYAQDAMKTLSDQANLQLLFKLLGGANECEICFGKGIFSVMIANNIYVWSAAGKYINI